MLTGILPLVENVCCFKEGLSTFNPDCVVEESTLGRDENAGSSTMDPSCAVEELSGSLQSCEPFSVADKDPCNSLVAPDISGTEVLVGALNSISTVDSSRLSDEEGNDKVNFDDVPVIKFPDTTCSVPSRRSAFTAKSNQKNQTRDAARERGKTVVKRPLLDSILLRVARKRRSYLCKPARSSVWGSWGYITQVFEKNSGYDVSRNGKTKSQKARGVRGNGKRNRNHSQSSRGKNCPSSGHIRLKVTLGRELIQNCQTNMVSMTDCSLKNCRGCSIEVLKSTEGSENKIDEELPGINGYQLCNQDQEKVVMSSDATHLGLCVLNKALEIPTINEKSTGVNAGHHHTRSSQVVVDNRYLDSGTSPDSEVINLIQDAQVNGKVQDDFYDVLSSSQACVAPGDVTDLDMSQISSKKGKNKNKLPHADNFTVEDLPLPEIINNTSELEIRGHGEKMGDVFYSSEPSISTTIANVSGNTSSSEGFSSGPLSSLGGTDSGVPFENFKVEGEAEDIHFRHGVGVDSNVCDKLHLHKKTKGRKHFKISKPVGVSKTGSEAFDSPRSQKGNACKQQGNTEKSICRRKGKDKGSRGEVTCKEENHPETGTESFKMVEDHSSADCEKLKTGNESTTKKVFDLDTVPKCVGEQNLPPQSAWVCCDACLKWRRIPATLADLINETNGKWICQDNMDQGFAHCSIPQEMSNSEINAELQISDASCGEDASDAHLNSKRLEPKHSTVYPRSSWMLIKSNLFLHRTRKRQTIDEIMVCHCKPPRDGKMGCADGCLNRMLNIECVRGTCPCGELCSNQQFQKRKYANLNRVRCGKKGYGLETREDICEGRFLIEYVGEVLDMQAYEARQREYASMGHKHFYFMTLNGSEVIDACAKGNLGRFINHSCDPNCRTEKWMVNGEVCIGLFALRDIKKGEELTFDYNYVRVFGAAAKECVCGSSQCRGYLGGDPQNTEEIVKGESDEEYPEPVMFYEDGEIDDNWKQLISATSSFDTAEKMAGHILGNKDKMGKSAIAGGHVESIRELQIGGIQAKEEDEMDISATAVQPMEITAGSSLIKFASGAQLHNSLEVDASVEGLLPNLPEESRSHLDEKSNKPISEAQKEFVQGLKTCMQTVISKPLSDAINTKKKFKCDAEDRHESKARPRLKTSRSSSSVKKGKLCCNSLQNVKSELIVNKSHVLAYKSRKIIESSLNNRFEAVEEKLNELLDADGGISKRKDATKGYLKLLLLTATSGDSGNGEAIQSNRDLSMILDALLKTRSRIVLVDIISKNGLQMLHNIMKRYRRNFNKIPILRKLLKVLEYLAVREILTLEHINGGPRCLGVESFRESILTLTEHDDKQVHQIARNFRDRWIPRPVRKSSCMDRSDGRVEFLRDSDCNRCSPSYIHGRDKVGKIEEAISSIKQSVIVANSDDTCTPEGCSTSGTGSVPTNGARTRKRKSRWDQPAEISFNLISTLHKEPEIQPSLLQNAHAVPQNEFGINREDKLKVENREDDIGQKIDEDVPPGFSPDDLGQKIDEDVPPGFSVLSNASSVSTDINHETVIPLEFPTQVIMGHPNRRFNNRLATSYGIPLPVVQQFGIPQAETLESWIVAPGMPFQPFPPLPPYPRGKRISPPPCIPSQVTQNVGEQICHSDQNTPCTSSGARIPMDVQIQGEKNQHTFQWGNGTHSLGRRYFRQRKWNNPQVGPPWIQKRNGSGFMVNNSRNGFCSSLGVATVVNEVDGQISSEYVNPGVQNSSHTHQYPQQQTYH